MPTPPEDIHRNEPLPDLETLKGLIERSSFHDELVDPRRRRQRVYEALANSDDPVWREIGQGLRDGHIKLREILQVDAYREHMLRGLAEHQDDFRRAVIAARAQLEAESERQDGNG